MNYLLYILVAAMPFIITDNLWDYSNLPKILFIQNGVILLAVVFFWTRKFKKKGYEGWDITVSRTLIAYMVFLGWAGLSLFWAVNKCEALEIFTHWVVCGMFLFLVQNMNINKTIVFLILVFTAWIVALIGLGQHWFHLDWVIQSARPASTFANRNLAGAYILMAMPLCVAFMVSVYQRMEGKQRLLCLGVFAIVIEIMLSYLYAAQFKTGLVVIVMVGTYYLVKYLRRLDYIVIAIVIVGLFVAGCLYMTPKFFDGGLRMPILRNTAKIIKQHPIVGVGVGNFKVYYDKYSDLRINTNETHNDYVHLLCELGIVGIYLAFLVGVYTYRGAVKKCDLYPTALKAGLAVFCIVAIFMFPMQKAALPFISALYLGMLKV